MERRHMVWAGLAGSAVLLVGLGLFGLGLVAGDDDDSASESTWRLGDFLSGAARRSVRRLPNYMARPDDYHHPDCDPKTSISGVNNSKKSYGDAQMKVEQSIIRQVSKGLTSNIVRTDRSTQQTGRRFQAQRVVEQELRVVSEFKHGHLIRFPQQLRYDSSYWTVGCLDIAESIQALEEESAVPRAEFEAYARSAIEASERGDASAFAWAYTQARGHLNGLASTRASIRSLRSARRARSASARASKAHSELSGQVSGRGGGSEAGLDQLEMRLVKEAVRFRGSTRFALVVKGEGGRALHEEVGDQVRASISAMGLDASGSGCRSDSGTTHELSVTTEPGFDYDGLGYSSRPRLELSLRSCRSRKALFRVTIQDRKFAGIGQDSHEAALRRAISRGLKPELVSRHLRPDLGGYFPLD